MKRVIFDIETIGADFNSLDKEQQEYLLKFAKTEEEREAEKEKLSLYPFTSLLYLILKSPSDGIGIHVSFKH